MERIFSTLIILALFIFDSLEPIIRRKDLYFSVKIDQEKSKDKSIYRNYLKKVFFITMPIGILLWYYYPIESNIFAFLCGLIVMVLLNLLFYFAGRKEVKDLYQQKN
ncbi:MAG TPA: hypothetical protein VJ962_10975 [Clostridia bacterium]|nr:hypothetical protein [Clostridia bacterium]